MAQRPPSTVPPYAPHHHHHHHHSVDYAAPNSSVYARHHDQVPQRSSPGPAWTPSYGGHFNPGHPHQPPSPTARYYPSQTAYDHQQYDYQQSHQPGPIRPRTISQSHSYHGVPYPHGGHGDFVVLSHRNPGQSEWSDSSPMQRPQTTIGSRPPLARIDTAPAAPEGYFASSAQYSPFASSPVPRAPSTEDARTSSSSSTQPSPVTNTARPHVCDICSTAFARGHDLKRHKETHNNTKPHTCECGKSFTRKDALKRHVFLKSCGKDASRDD